MIEVNGLSRKYGDKVVLDDLSFILADGKIHGILGPSGAGKSTLADILGGALVPSAGSVKIGDNVIGEIEAKKKIGYLPESPSFYEEMTPYEYLAFVGQVKNVPSDKLYRNIDSVLELTQTEEVKDVIIKNISPSEKKRVGIAQTMLGNPDVIILDEPTLSLEPKMAREMKDMIKRLGEVKTIIITAHRLSDIIGLCDDVIMLLNGKIIAQDTIDELEARLGKRETLAISVRGEEEKVVGALSAIEAIEACTVIENNGEEISLKLEYTSGEDIKDALFSALSGVECPLISMKVDRLTLDDVYRRIVASNNDSDQRGE